MYVDAHAVIAEAIHGRAHARIPCPVCSPSRKKKHDPCLAADRADDGVVFICNHCGWKGVIPDEPKANRRTYVSLSNPAQDALQSAVTNAVVVPLIQPSLGTINPKHASYMQGRGISEATLRTAGVFSTKRYFQSAGGELDCLAFPYRNNAGQVIGHKYRTGDTKHFAQDQGGVNIFFGSDRLNKKLKSMLITEGEIDALSCMEVGFDNVVSVPNGAPTRIANRKIHPSEDARFSYVWEAHEILDDMDRVVLATDRDAPGEALREELARRIGKHKCWLVEYPEDCKDANDVLKKYGKEKLSDCIIDAKPYPISALYTAADFEDDVKALYAKRSLRGALTGFDALNSLYTVAPGQLSIVTGFPSHGKSSFVDQLCVNLANQYSWKTALCSFENTPSIHIAHLMELKIGKPFFQPPQGERISEQEYDSALKWVEEHFGFIDFKGAEPPTIDNILQRAQAAVQRLGVRGLVIDPYNYVRLDKGASETDAISDMLTKVQAFAKSNDCHVWFVAHPQKVYGTDQSFTPGGGHVSGSAAWWAKADCGLTVHRAQTPGETLIDVWKCRYRWVGQQGRATVSYDSTTGGFSG